MTVDSVVTSWSRLAYIHVQGVSRIKFFICFERVAYLGYYSVCVTPCTITLKCVKVTKLTNAILNANLKHYQNGWLGALAKYNRIVLGTHWFMSIHVPAVLQFVIGQKEAATWKPQTATVAHVNIPTNQKWCSIMTVYMILNRWRDSCQDGSGLRWNAKIRSCSDRRRTATGRRTISRRIQSVCDSRDVSQASETGCSSRFSRCHKRHEGDLVGSMKEAVARWSWPLLVLETGGLSMTIFLLPLSSALRALTLHTRPFSNTWYSRDSH